MSQVLVTEYSKEILSPRVKISPPLALAASSLIASSAAHAVDKASCIASAFRRLPPHHRPAAKAPPTQESTPAPKMEQTAPMLLRTSADVM
jgi:hypothetical protein